MDGGPSINQQDKDRVDAFLARHTDELDACLLHDVEVLRLASTSRAGFLWKRSVSGWYRYWFALKGSELFYFERAKRRGPLAGVLHLFQSKAVVATAPKRTLEIDLIDANNKTHVLRAETKREMHFWLVAFAVARKTTPPARKIVVSPSLSNIPGSTGPLSSSAASSGQATPQSQSGRGGLWRRSTTLLPSSVDKDIPGNPISDNAPSTIDSDSAPVIPQLLSNDRVDHLVWVVHGIGAKRHIFTRNVHSLRDSFVEIMAKIYPDIDYNLEFIGLHWKDMIMKLESYQRMSKIIPVNMAEEKNPLREFMVDKVVDFMYYAQPRYRSAILRFVCRQLNEQFYFFKERHPEFDGGVSIYAHSLGSVICYELFARRALEDPALLKEEGLWVDFALRNLFIVGSPLAEFLNLDDALRSTFVIKKLPFHIFNVFHPNDPVAMRMEPLLEEDMHRIAPVELPYWWSMDRKTSTVRWLGNLWGGSSASNNAIPSKTIVAMSNLGAASNGSSLAAATVAAMTTSGGVAPMPVGAGGLGMTASSRGSREMNRSSKDFKSQDELGELLSAFVDQNGVRMDYGLQIINAMEEVSKTYSATKAHTDYWESRDVMLFLICSLLKQHLHRLVPGKQEFDITKVLVLEDGDIDVRPDYVLPDEEAGLETKSKAEMISPSSDPRSAGSMSSPTADKVQLVENVVHEVVATSGNQGLETPIVDMEKVSAPHENGSHSAEDKQQEHETTDSLGSPQITEAALSQQTPNLVESTNLVVSETESSTRTDAKPPAAKVDQDENQANLEAAVEALTALVNSEETDDGDVETRTQDPPEDVDQTNDLSEFQRIYEDTVVDQGATSSENDGPENQFPIRFIELERSDSKYNDVSDTEPRILTFSAPNQEAAAAPRNEPTGAIDANNFIEGNRLPVTDKSASQNGWVSRWFGFST